MKKLTAIICLVALLVLTGCRVQIMGEWDPDLPGHFIASTPLESGDSYFIRNNTPETVYVWLLDDRTPREYFTILPGGSREFTSPGESFDLYIGGGDPKMIKDVALWWIPN